MAEQYCFKVGDNGQEGLSILEKIFNDQTQYFLDKHGLQKGMTVLDVGCGLGLMTQILAERVGPSGRVLAIDNNENQIKAAMQRTPDRLKSIIDYKVHDIYALEKLSQTFDVVYCRFVLHHVHRPLHALSQISKVLKPGGLYIGIEGIMNYAYSYPLHTAWQAPDFPIEVNEGEDRNGNIGKILPYLIKKAGMHCQEALIVQPMLMDDESRQLLLVCNEDSDAAEEKRQEKYQDLKDCIEDEDTLIAFYAGNFTASRKKG